MTGVVLVTGAGRGIGAGIARLAGQRGYKVGVNYSRSTADAQKVVADIERAGGKAIAIQGDVGEEKDVVAMFETMDKAFGPVTALVNNAGILGKPTSTSKLGADLVDNVLWVNVTGTLMCSREAIRRMSCPRARAARSSISARSQRARGAWPAASPTPLPKVRWTP